jgi:hypothetical protein
MLIAVIGGKLQGGGSSLPCRIFLLQTKRLPVTSRKKETGLPPWRFPSLTWLTQKTEMTDITWTITQKRRLKELGNQSAGDTGFVF